VMATVTATVDYGDGSAAQTLILNADKSFALNQGKKCERVKSWMHRNCAKAPEKRSVCP